MRQLLLLAAVLVVLLGVWWLSRGANSRRGLAQEHDALAAAVEPEEVAMVEAPMRILDPRGATTAGTRLAPIRVADVPDVPASKSKGPRRLAPIRGRLMIAGTEEVLDEVLKVRLRTGDLSAKEALETAADGSFVTERPFPRGYLLAEVLRPDGETAIDYEGFFDPSSDEEWIVSVPWPNSVSGRLIRNGEPLEDFGIELQQNGLSHGLDDATKRAAGCFTFSGLTPGSCTVIVRKGFERHEFSIALSRGRNEIGDVLVPFRERGSIRGRLHSTLRSKLAGVLVLTDVDSGASYEDETRSFPDSPGVAWFQFEEIPVSDYRLTLHASDGLRYATPIRSVRPAADDVEFVATEEIEPLQFRAMDGPSGHEIAAWNAWVLSRGRWNDQPEVPVEAADVERWVLVADGHRPASSGRPESARVEARLEPGWTCALFFTEGLGNHAVRKGPVAGVEVRAEGVLVARSDRDGLALVSLPSPPAKLECSLDGWVFCSDVRNTIRGDDDGPLLTLEFNETGAVGAYFQLMRE